MFGRWASSLPHAGSRAPLIRDSDLAPEKSRIRGDVDGVFLERGERNDVKRPFMGGRQHYVGGRAVLVRPQPVHRGHTPAVAGREPREVVLRHRGDQVVADTTLVLEERGCDHRADRVAPLVLRTGTTAPVTVKAGEGIGPAGLELTAQHGRLVATVSRQVRGVVISRQEISVAEWTQLLAQYLAQLAAESADARLALSKLLEGN